MNNISLGKGLTSLIPKKPLGANTPSLLEKEQSLPAGLRLKKESIFNIETDKIKPNPNQPRQKFFPDSLKELAESIREHGILQPLLVAKVEKETQAGREVEYQLIAGERRWRAAQMIGLPHVPVIIRDNSEREKLEISLIENLQREDLNPIESARAYRQLHEDFGLKHREIAKRIGKSRVAITNAVRLLDLPGQILQAVESGQISEGHGRALLTVKAEDQRLKLFEKTIEEKLSVRQLEDKARGGGVFTVSKAHYSKRDPMIVAIEKQLTHHFSARVCIRQRDKAGRLLIDFYNQKELDDLVERLIRS